MTQLQCAVAGACEQLRKWGAEWDSRLSCNEGDSWLCMQGIVGGTYDRFIMGESAVSDPKSQLYLPADVSIVHPPCVRYMAEVRQ